MRVWAGWNKRTLPRRPPRQAEELQELNQRSREKKGKNERG